MTDQETVQLQNIVGYSKNTSGSPLLVNRDVLYSAGRVCVLLNLQSKKQIFYTGHTWTVTSIAYNSRSKLVASAQAGGNGKTAQVHLWCPFTLQTKCVFDIGRKYSGVMTIQSIAFTACGTRLLAAAFAKNEKSLMMFQTKKEGMHTRPCCTFQGQAVLDITGIISDYRVDDIEFMHFATYGKNGVHFWRYHRINNVMKPVRAPLGTSAEVLTLHCVKPGSYVAGTVDGKVIYLDQGRNVKTIQKNPVPVCWAGVYGKSVLALRENGTLDLFYDNPKFHHTIIDLFPGNACVTRNELGYLHNATLRGDTLIIAGRSHLLKVTNLGKLESKQQKLEKLMEYNDGAVKVADNKYTNFYAVADRGRGDACSTIRFYGLNALLPFYTQVMDKKVTAISMSCTLLAVGCSDSTVLVYRNDTHELIFNRKIGISNVQKSMRRRGDAIFPSLKVEGRPIVDLSFSYETMGKKKEKTVFLAASCKDDLVYTIQFQFNKPNNEGFEVGVKPQGIQKQQVMVLYGHRTGDYPKWVQFNDGPAKYVISASGQGFMVIWDVVTGQRINMENFDDAYFYPWRLPTGEPVDPIFNVRRRGSVAELMSDDLAPGRRCVIQNELRHNLIAVSDPESCSIKLYPLKDPQPDRNQSEGRAQGVHVADITSMVWIGDNLISAGLDSVIAHWAMPSEARKIKANQMKGNQLADHVLNLDSNIITAEDVEFIRSLSPSEEIEILDNTENIKNMANTPNINDKFSMHALAETSPLRETLKPTPIKSGPIHAQLRATFRNQVQTEAQDEPMSETLSRVHSRVKGDSVRDMFTSHAEFHPDPRVQQHAKSQSANIREIKLTKAFKVIVSFPTKGAVTKVLKDENNRTFSFFCEDAETAVVNIPFPYVMSLAEVQSDDAHHSGGRVIISIPRQGMKGKYTEEVVEMPLTRARPEFAVNQHSKVMIKPLPIY